MPDGQDASFLDKYKVSDTAAGAGTDTAFLDKYKVQPAPQETMSAQPSLLSRVEKLVAPGPGKIQFGGGPASTIENYTPEGRAEHPILSRIGDITSKAKEYGRMVGALTPLIPEGEAVRALKGIGSAGAEEAIPTVEATATNRPAPREPLPPPAVRTAYRTEIPGTIQDPRRLGPTGEAGVIVPEQKLLPIGRTPPSRVTMAQPEVKPLAPGASPEEAKFHKLFGSEYQEAGDLAEWETGSREGVVPKPALQPIGTKKPTVGGVVNQAMGVKPLERNVPLREQQLRPIPREAPAAPPAPETDPLKIKYPDPGVRKFARANGEAVVDAVGDDKELMQKIHDLKNIDVREAAVNAGMDLGTKHVGSKGELGPEQISRQEVLTKLLQQGIKPNKILELAKPKSKGE